MAEGLRPLLARGVAPRVVIVSSSASFGEHDQVIVAACLDGDENRSRQLAASGNEDDAKARLGLIYAASKRAVTRWIRRTAPRAEWAGAGILLNGVAPGLVVTPMTAPLLATSEGREVLARAVPRGVAEPAEPRDLALLLAFLAGPENRYMVGQVPFCDGGSEVIVRGDAFF
jgi:NAD(P)-dependent dehydrogenase (short-subunit alcohol dehydrogenase family)